MKPLVLQAIKTRQILSAGQLALLRNLRRCELQECQYVLHDVLVSWSVKSRTLLHASILTASQKKTKKLARNVFSNDGQGITR